MKTTIAYRTTLCVMLLGLAAGCGREHPQPSEALPTEEDIVVLATALGHFAKADFDVEIWLKPDSPLTNRTMIVIADHSNTDGDFIDDPSIEQATEDSGRKTSRFVKREIRRRNSVPVPLQALQNGHDSFRIAPTERLSWWGSEFQESFPDARAYVKPWLPAYNRRRTSALVLFDFGPRHHPTVATYILDKSDGQWKIVWHDFAYYM